MPYANGRKHEKKEFVPDELDLAILRALPEEGSKIGKYLADGRAIADLAREVDPSIRSEVFSGRVRAMSFHKLTLFVKGAKTGENVWQRTAAGSALVAPRLSEVKNEVADVH